MVRIGFADSTKADHHRSQQRAVMYCWLSISE